MGTSKTPLLISLGSWIELKSARLQVNEGNSTAWAIDVLQKIDMKSISCKRIWCHLPIKSRIAQMACLGVSLTASSIFSYDLTDAWSA